MEPINDAQRAMAERIAAYGRNNGIKQHLIDAAVKFAYIESKLGAVESKGNNADGLFQYKPNPWKERHQKTLGRDRWSASNQIAAMFKDLQSFEGRYRDPSNTGIPRNAVTLEEYLYIKHHDGPSSEAFAPGLNHRREPNGLMVYRRDNPTYDASAIFGPKTSVAPIRNPWEVTFGLPGGTTVNGFESISLNFNNDNGGPGPAAARHAGGAAGRHWTDGRSWHWPAMYNDWRSPAIDRGAGRRGYVDSHYYDPNTGASVSTRHRFKRAVAEMTEAMAGTAPQGGFGPGAPEMTASMPRHHSMLAVQA